MSTETLEYCAETVWLDHIAMVCSQTIVAGACPRHGDDARRHPVKPTPREDELTDLLAEVEAERDAAKEDANRSWNRLTNARKATRRLTSYLIANASRLDVPFSNAAGTPWSMFVAPSMNWLRFELGMRGQAANCCDLHGRTCEPGEACCEECSEGAHPHHVDGSFCSAPDLSGNHMPTAVEDALRDEVERLGVELGAARRAAACAGSDRIDADLDRVRARRELEAARPVVEAAVAYENRWRRYAGIQPGADSTEVRLAKGHAHQALLNAVRTAAVDLYRSATSDHPTTEEKP